MKRIYDIKYLTLITLILAICSCTDVLDETPSDSLSTERLLKSESGMMGLRDLAYDFLDKDFTSFHSGEMLEVFTDDAVKAGNGKVYDWHNGYLAADNAFFAEQLWNKYWGGIRKCNLALEYLPQSQVPEDKISKTDIERWMDEVKVLRAWYHFELIRNFGALPFVDEVISDDYPDFTGLTRPTFDNIANKLIEELDAVIENDILKIRSPYTTEYDKVNLGVAYALKSRIALYAASALNNPEGDAQKWTLAQNQCSEAIEKLKGEYFLVSIDDYQSLFIEAINVENSEIIFKGGNQENINNSNGVDIYTYFTANRANNCGAVPTQELVDCFELSDGSLPIDNYDEAHTSPVFNSVYTEEDGEAIYANRDARLNYAVVFNGCNYGRYKNMPDAESDMVIYTYEGKEYTGFNSNVLSQEEADKRRSITGYYGRKFRQADYWGVEVGGTNSRKIHFRMAELYLNLAEAECQLGNLDKAIEALNVVRLRAGQPGLVDVPGFENTKDFILKRIYNERRVELCFEGHRFYDQRRWNDLSGNKVATGMKIISSDGTDGGTFSYQRVNIGLPREAYTDKYLYLPLTVEEARRLTGIGQPSEYY